MNYIVFDLELNSKPFKNRHPNEIIEIGAVKLDKNLEFTGEFQSFVKPRVYKKLFGVIKRKTKISQADVDNAQELRDVLAEFKEWAGKGYTLCSWGHDDIHHFRTNCRFNHMGVNWLNKNVIDVQKQFLKIYSLPLGQVHSLEKALEIMGISPRENLHRADADARYTAEILLRISDKLGLAALSI